MAEEKELFGPNGKKAHLNLPKDITGKTSHELLKPLIFPNSDRAFKLFNATIVAGITIYFVFFHKFPEDKENVFSPIRRFTNQYLERFFTIQPEDEEYVKQRVEQLTAKSKPKAQSR